MREEIPSCEFILLTLKVKYKTLRLLEIIRCKRYPAYNSVYATFCYFTSLQPNKEEIDALNSFKTIKMHF